MENGDAKLVTISDLLFVFLIRYQSWRVMSPNSAHSWKKGRQLDRTWSLNLPSVSVKSTIRGMQLMIKNLIWVKSGISFKVRLYLLLKLGSTLYGKK